LGGKIPGVQGGTFVAGGMNRHPPGGGGRKNYKPKRPKREKPSFPVAIRLEKHFGWSKDRNSSLQGQGAMNKIQE